MAEKVLTEPIWQEWIKKALDTPNIDLILDSYAIDGMASRMLSAK